jgi:hypothetical protein
LTFGDFKDLFKKIRFEISSSELNHFFTFNNETAKEGYILGKNFLSSFRDEIKWYDGREETLLKKSSKLILKGITNEKKNSELKLSNENKNSDDVINNKNLPSTESFKKEFQLLKDEILQIVQRNDIASGKKIIKIINL